MRSSSAALTGGERLLQEALRLGGSISGEHGVGWVKRAFLGAQWDAATLAAHERVKAALDPKGLLNPGKKQPLARPQPPTAWRRGREPLVSPGQPCSDQIKSALALLDRAGGDNSDQTRTSRPASKWRRDAST